MTPEEYTDKIKSALGDELESVILYGSAAAGDHHGKASDYNIMIITKNLGVQELKKISQISAPWGKSGNPPPLMFTKDRILKSADTFPIELLDIRDSHKVLFGDDIFREIDLDTNNFRLILEHELKSKLIQLREAYITTGGNSKAVCNLMSQSLSTFLVLMRAVLRMYENNVPTLKADAANKLVSHIPFDIGTIQAIEKLKSSKPLADSTQSDKLFADYLQLIETIVDTVDKLDNMNIKDKA